MELKIKVISIVFIFCALILAGCARDRSSLNPGQSSVELTYWPAPNSQEIELADSLVKAWNRIHPQIHVRMQPIPVSKPKEEVFRAAIAEKTPPDVFSNIGPE